MKKIRFIARFEKTIDINILKNAVLDKCLLFLLFTNVFCVMGKNSEAATWYLDASARGRNNGTSWVDSWSSVTQINWNNIQPGDTLLVQGGMYPNDLNITNKSDITVRIAPNATEQAVFFGSSLYNLHNCLIDGYLNGKQYLKITKKHAVLNNALTIRESRNLTIRGIEIDRSSEFHEDTQPVNGVQVNGAQDFIIFEYNYIHHTTGDGINFTHPPSQERNAYDSYIIRFNKITNIGDDAVQNAMQTSIHDNFFDKNGFMTYFGAHPDGFQSFSGKLGPSANYKIYNNVIKGFNQNIFIEYARSNVLIYNNILIGGNTKGTDRGINYSYWDFFTGTFLIANNIMYNFLSFLSWNGGLPASAVVGNNIFLNCKLIASPGTGIFLDKTNIYWDTANVQYYNTEGIPVGISSNRYAGDSVYKDPKFESLDSFKLQKDSPAIGTGKNLNNYFTTDFVGAFRGEKWDIGVYQHSDGISAPKGLKVIQ